jgi:hypothetical protein
LTLTDDSEFTPITDLVNDAVNTSINPRKLKSVALYVNRNNPPEIMTTMIHTVHD